MGTQVRVEGSISRCYECGLKGQIRAACPPPYKKVKEEGEEMVGVLLFVEVEEGEYPARNSTSIGEEKNNTWETDGKMKRKKGVCCE